MKSLWNVLVQLNVLLLSLTNLSCATPITAPFRNTLTLPQCPIHHSSALGAPVEHFHFHLSEGSPAIDLDVLYCPGLPIRSEDISHTLYRAMFTMNQHVQRQGPNAPLESGTYTTPEERGYNSLFTISSEAGPVRVGVVVDVLKFLRRWMVRQQHLGSTLFIVNEDGRKTATGGVRPIVDPALVSA